MQESQYRVFILGRYNIKFYDRLLPNKIIYQWEKDFTGKLKIKYKTMHGAKGLEADYVFVLGMNAGKFGFQMNLKMTRYCAWSCPKKKILNLPKSGGFFMSR